MSNPNGSTFIDVIDILITQCFKIRWDLKAIDRLTDQTLTHGGYNLDNVV